MPQSKTSSSPSKEGGGSAASNSSGFDDVPLNRFHLRITALTFCANYSDGYELGIISIALPLIAAQLGFGTVWEGLLGASALIGIFLGSIVVGWAADKIGRQRLYTVDFLLIAVASAAEFFVTSPTQLFILRLLIGIGIGADYALGPTLVAEFVPRKYRGGLLASLTVLWTVGYVAAFFLGNYVVSLGAESWRWLLASSSIPAIAVVLLRIGVPESPRWLLSQGRVDQARAVVERLRGDVEAFEDLVRNHVSARRVRYRELFGKKYWRNTAFGTIFYNAQVVPYFAIYTFLPLVLLKMGVGEEDTTSDGLLNLFLLAGSLGGLWLVAKMSRRGLTIWSFVVLIATMAPMAIWPDAPTALVFPLFLVFTFTMSAAVNLDQVYPPELFPTDLRSSGVGLLNGLSRVGSAIGTFLLPLALDGIGFSPTMLILTLVLVGGLVVSLLWAPETKNSTMD
ncbi:MFS transporter [Amycolatopsis sp. DSM 110486]|uniref:MFS transporter n=1 Tax=Amycolatopsis sp. DSM 110486 TaxID=2865832 RepID=UPI001C6A0F50|nr:MFS transporter [Amycolatopsis sp. DSM 110486]QYN25520.1 MFS transporter [Amycolatopsis sp. DSM 110486]